MRRVLEGDTVSLHLVARVAGTGELLDSTRETNEPLSFVVGRHTVIPGLEDAVTGMSVGEVRSVDVSPERAFGLRDERRVTEIERDRVPPEAEEGDILRVDGAPMAVIEITGSFVVVDGNHPLAGKALSLEVELLDIAGVAPAAGGAPA
ncbi:MAG: FKBP-type peptidyl-prolyl cis-trans isomerase [Dehalococcoidia bacterium]|nr:peptidylprolyl isomerase [Chloroflexi bacterium CFX7]MCK6564626.1 FKBP-type peptidyl-prolyl cis-trans isomerase [Dehalococcoidia bacterium]NUQ54335.1 FKBP-type peptidyl-prolyl cis-trans isomerase [Dehalococcoidia bacterium]RIL01731.1 MAG: peptidylprolyl isomerase [bacterium]